MSGKTTVSAAHFTDDSGNSVSNVVFYFQPCTVPGGQPIAYHGGGDTPGQRSSQPVQTLCTSGAFSVTLDDTALTNPVNIGYAVTALDISGKNLLGPGYVIQPTGPTWNFDSFFPNLIGMITAQYGPAGTIAIRNVTAGPTPAIYNVGTASNAILDVTLPQGATGLTGPPGPAGANSTVGSISGTFARQSYAASGSTTAFLLPVSGVPLVFRNGLLQETGTDYTQSGTTVTFTFTPPSGDRITLVVFPAS